MSTKFPNTTNAFFYEILVWLVLFSCIWSFADDDRNIRKVETIILVTTIYTVVS